MREIALNNKCKKMSDCPYFNKFPRHASSYKYVYCEGSKLDSCARLSYKEENGVKPPDGLAPTGILIELED